MTGWNNLAFLGTDCTPIDEALACLTLPAGTQVNALWLFSATSQTRWTRNLYFPDGTSSIHMSEICPGQTFWILAGP